jgi:DDE superfamily endonuclease
VCLDEFGPESAKIFPGHQPVRAQTTSADMPAERAKQEADYGRRGYGYVFGAFRPHTGDALTRCYDWRTIANWIEFLGHVEAWVYAIVDNLNTHRAADVLLFCLAHPRWEFVFQPVYAAYLNLIEP